MFEEVKVCEGCKCSKSLKEFNRSYGGYAHGASHYPDCKLCCKYKCMAATAIVKELGITKRKWIETVKESVRKAEIEKRYQAMLLDPPVLVKKTVVLDNVDLKNTFKVCRYCKVEKSLEHYNNGSGKYGKLSACRVCTVLRHRSETEAAHAAGLSISQWMKVTTRQERSSAKDVQFYRMLKDVLNSGSIEVPPQPTYAKKKKARKLKSKPKVIRITDSDPILNEVRLRHKAQLGTLVNKTTRLKEGFLYIITNPAWPDAVKIGCAIDYERRFNCYNIYSPLSDYKLEHTRYFEDRVAAESQLKEMMQDSNISGEWHRASVEETKLLIDSIYERSQKAI